MLLSVQDMCTDYTQMPHHFIQGTWASMGFGIHKGF